jgi:hypothetical protein
LRGDILDRPLVERAVRGADVVVHYAAESHVSYSICLPTSTYAGPLFFVRQSSMRRSRSLFSCRPRRSTATAFRRRCPRRIR